MAAWMAGSSAAWRADLKAETRVEKMAGNSGDQTAGS